MAKSTTSTKSNKSTKSTKSAKSKKPTKSTAGSRATASAATADSVVDENSEAESAPPKERREPADRRKVQRRRQIDPTTCERDYSGEEIEFMRAMDDYKRANGRMFPTCSEILEVIRELGYQRPELAEDESIVGDEVTSLDGAPIFTVPMTADVTTHGTANPIG